jgi:hypothetical protein
MINLQFVEIDTDIDVREQSKLTFKKFDRNPEVLSAYHSFEGEQERLRNLNLRYVITPFLLLHQKMNPPKLFFCRTLSLIFPNCLHILFCNHTIFVVSIRTQKVHRKMSFGRISRTQKYNDCFQRYYVHF